jgi:hypothetical protein
MASSSKPPGAADERESVSLVQATENVIDECRMVLPGIQALFGFQLIVVFSDGFDSHVSGTGRVLHLAATGLVAIAVALIMTPAAFHRQTATRHVSSGFLRLASRLLILSMLPLAIGISLDFYLVARVVVDFGVALGAAVVLFLIFMALWYGLPRLRRMRDLAGAKD